MLLRRKKAKDTHLRKEVEEERACTGSFVLKFVSIFYCQGFQGGLKRGSQRNIHQLSRCVLSGSPSLLIDRHQGRVHESLQLDLRQRRLSGFAAFLGLEQKYN